MSDGCVAMQASLVPRMACCRLMPAYRRAAGVRRALIAGRRGVVEIEAARPLQQVAAGRCHIAQLTGRTRQDRAREQRIARLDNRVIRKVAVRNERTDLQPAFCRLLDRLQRQTRDVDQPRRLLDVLLHQVDQVGAARDELCVRVGTRRTQRVGDRACARVFEINHGRAPFITCRIAATMFGYAPQRQRLPLISSRTSSLVFALPSASSPAAEQSCPGVQ